MYEGQLVRALDGTWMTKPPNRCPNGHTLGPNQVLVGHVACLGHGGGGHTSWHCRTCEAVVYGPQNVSPSGLHTMTATMWRATRQGGRTTQTR
jgi:hypothetical protein